MKCPTCGDMRAEFFSMTFWTCPICDAPKPEVKDSAAVKKEIFSSNTHGVLYSLGNILVDESSDIPFAGKCVYNSSKNNDAVEIDNSMNYSWIITDKAGNIRQGGVVKRNPETFLISGPACLIRARTIIIDHYRKTIEVTERVL